MLVEEASSEKLFGTSLEIIPGNLPVYVLIYLLLTLLIGIASGLYASSYLSRLKVIDVLKQRISIGKNRSIFRSALIVIQLMIFCSFISGTLIVRSQYRFALNMDPGYNNKDVLQVNLGRDFNNYNVLLNGIKSFPEVISAAGNSILIKHHRMLKERDIAI